jgi:hypothetical protein
MCCLVKKQTKKQSNKQCFEKESQIEKMKERREEEE